MVSLLVFFLITRQADYTLDAELEYNLLQIVPYLVVLVGALIGFNVFLVLISGTVLSLIVGAATGTIEPLGIFSAVGEGVTGMYDITVISLLVACVVALMREYGGISYILQFIRKRIRGQKGAQLGIALLALLDPSQKKSAMNMASSRNVPHLCWISLRLWDRGFFPTAHSCCWQRRRRSWRHSRSCPICFIRG